VTELVKKFEKFFHEFTKNAQRAFFPTGFRWVKGFTKNTQSAFFPSGFHWVERCVPPFSLHSEEYVRSPLFFYYEVFEGEREGMLFSKSIPSHPFSPKERAVLFHGTAL
jgi:hypothetical protein